EQPVSANDLRPLLVSGVEKDRLIAADDRVLIDVRPQLVIGALAAELRDLLTRPGRAIPEQESVISLARRQPPSDAAEKHAQRHRHQARQHHPFAPALAHESRVYR